MSTDAPQTTGADEISAAAIKLLAHVNRDRIVDGGPAKSVYVPRWRLQQLLLLVEQHQPEALAASRAARRPA